MITIENNYVFNHFEDIALGKVLNVAKDLAATEFSVVNNNVNQVDIPPMMAEPVETPKNDLVRIRTLDKKNIVQTRNIDIEEIPILNTIEYDKNIAASANVMVLVAIFVLIVLVFVVTTTLLKAFI